MSVEHRNNGDTTPPSTPSRNKDKDKNPETEEQEEEVTEEEKKQQKQEALMRILDVEEKKANEKLERIRRERERAGALSQDIKAHRLDDHGEVELADLLCGSSLQRSKVSDETNNESTSEEDVYQVPPEKDGGKKRRRAERKREKKGKGKQLGRLEKRRRTERIQPDTEDPEVKRLDEAGAWVANSAPSPASIASGLRRTAARRRAGTAASEKSSVPTCWRTRIVNRRLGGQSSGRRVPEVRGASPVRRDTRHTLMQRDIDLLTSRADETDHRLGHDQAMLRQLALRVLQQHPGIAWARQYLHGIGENTDGESESLSSSEEMEETKRVRSWVKKIGANEEENPRSEDGHGGVDGDGDVEMEVPSTEVVPSTETTDGPSTFGPFVATSDGTVFHVNLESTTMVKMEEEESGIPHDNEEDLARRGRLRKKNKLNAKVKAKEAEKTAEEKPETEVKTEEHDTQIPVAQRPAPRVVEAPGVFFETATSTGKLIPVQVEMIEVLDLDDEAPAR
ncbi:hypothetical protein C8R45DRAFT_1097933 [Mycena sanguinolenta]|nr:hypothetical protein C8R45DRAFT_1097933 [Mycena sanguinolenta]